MVVLKNEIPSCHHDLRHRMREREGKKWRHAEVTALSDTGTVLIWSSSHASLCLPWAISAHSHIHTICPIIPPLYNFSSLPSQSPSSSSSPFSFPSGVREGYVNGQGGGLRKRWEECEKGERCCRGHRWVIKWLHGPCVCVWVFSVLFLKVCVFCMSEWEVWFKLSCKQLCLFACVSIYLFF